MANPRGWALVTGASAGLGVEFARQLAGKGYALALTARRRERLEALAQELRAAHGVETLVIEADLSTREGPRAVVAALDARAIVPEVLVNNAGFGAHGPALEVDVGRTLEMIDLNVRALTELAIVFGGKMAARGSGAILNVASTAAFQPDPWFAAYGATKSYVLSFSLSLGHELGPRGVSVTCHCPGPTKTEFFEAGGVNVSLNDALVMSARECVAIGLRKMERGRRVAIAGWMNAVAAWFSRVSPLWMVVPVSGWLMRPVPRKALPPA
jgi:short-subunit dehydrogenase